MIWTTFKIFSPIFRLLDFFLNLIFFRCINWSWRLPLQLYGLERNTLASEPCSWNQWKFCQHWLCSVQSWSTWAEADYPPHRQLELLSWRFTWFLGLEIGKPIRGCWRKLCLQHWSTSAGKKNAKLEIKSNVFKLSISLWAFSLEKWAEVYLPLLIILLRFSLHDTCRISSLQMMLL